MGGGPPPGTPPRMGEGAPRGDVSARSVAAGALGGTPARDGPGSSELLASPASVREGHEAEQQGDEQEHSERWRDKWPKHGQHSLSARVAAYALTMFMNTNTMCMNMALAPIE